MNARRIEGTGVDPELDEGLAAPVADPLWLLARQWQVGEFRGEDAATPIIADVLIDSYPLTGYWTQPHEKAERTEVTRAAHGVPLEALAEREPVSPSRRLFASVEAGLALLRLLRTEKFEKKTLAAIRVAYPVSVAEDESIAERDPLGQAQLAMLAAGSLDAASLLAELAEVGAALDLAVVKSLTSDDPKRLAAALDAWSKSEAALEVRLGEEEASAWRDRSQSYRFGVTAATTAGPIELSAPAYPGGRLDWYDFDLSALPKELPKGKRQQVRVLASPLRFAGQPAQRWWEMEEGDTYFGDLAGGPDDLARSVIASYAAVAGDDWFVIPARLPSGSFARVHALRVYDNFSDEPVILEPAAHLDAAGLLNDRAWRWFELTHREKQEKLAVQLLFLPPAINATEQGAPLEEVAFRRDEMANMAWAIERTVEGVVGRGVRLETPPAESLPITSDGTWRFEIGSVVPGHWFPLVPVRIDADEPAVVLRRGVMARSEGEHVVPAGEILTPEKPFLLDEAELPSGGVRVSRRYQLARSSDGAAHLWVGRQKRPASGPMSRTPLHFDHLTGWPVARDGGR